MYKQVETDKTFTSENGNEITPVATLKDEHGGCCQIATDDHCYVVYTKVICHPLGLTNVYRMSPWIFEEAFQVLKTLPDLKNG